MARVIVFMYTSDYDDKSLPEFYIDLYLDDEEREDVKQEKGTRSLKEIDQLGLRKRLNVNALVYKLAEMLGIPELQKMASNRLMCDAEVSFDMDGFEEPAQLVYENTREDDRDLRYRLTKLCVENYDVLEIRPKTVAVLRDHALTGWDIIVDMLEGLGSDASRDTKVDAIIRHCTGKAVQDLNSSMAQHEQHKHGGRPGRKLTLRADGTLSLPFHLCNYKGRK